MPRDITITFDDGSTHVYKNAPDTVTPETVQKRAEAQFGKSVKGIDGGKQSAPVGAGDTPSKPQDNFFQAVAGLGEVPLQMITGLGSTIAGGLAGAGTALATGSLDKGADITRSIQQAGTYQPRTQSGKDLTGLVAAPFEKASQGMGMLGGGFQNIGAEKGLGQKPSIDAFMQGAMNENGKGEEGNLGGNIATQSLMAIAGKPTESQVMAAGSAIKNLGKKLEISPSVGGAEAAPNAKIVIDSGNQGALLDNIALMRKHEMAVNPNSTNPVLKNRAGAALVGDTGLNRGAYQINQPKANALAREDLGIPEGTPLTKPAYDDVKQGFVDVSKEVQDIPLFKTDKQYLDGLNEKSFIAELPEAEQALLKNSRQVNALLEKAALPEITGNGAIAIMRELRAKSSKVLNNPTADPAATALANAQRNVAKQIEAMIERRLDGMGKTDLAQRFKDERTLYAKAKAYESVTTPNGDINVPKLPSGKGHTSYTDNLKDLTDMGAAFPEAFTPPPKSGTGLNLTYGGRLNTALDILSTPVKNKMLSDAYQAKNASPPDFRIPQYGMLTGE